MSRYGVILVRDRKRVVTQTRIIDFTAISAFSIPESWDLQARFDSLPEAESYRQRLDLVYFADPETLKNLSA